MRALELRLKSGSTQSASVITCNVLFLKKKEKGPTVLLSENTRLPF